jgi:hypothetical protein
MGSNWREEYPYDYSEPETPLFDYLEGVVVRVALVG